MKLCFLLKRLSFRICLKRQPEDCCAKYRPLLNMRKESNVTYGLFHHSSHLQMSWNIQDTYHTGIIYITLCVDM